MGMMILDWLMMLKTKGRANRMESTRARKYLDIAMGIGNKLNKDVTFGVTGSTARGNLNKYSDLDLFIIVNKNNIQRLIEKVYRMHLFQIPSNKVISDFQKDKIDVIFLHGEEKGTLINAEIYSLNTVKNLLALNKITIRRFRTKPTGSSLTFGNAYGESISVNVQKWPFAEGFISSLPGSIEDKVVYVGNHLRKLLFGKIYLDHNKIKERINNCFTYFVTEAKQNNKFSKQCLANLSIYDSTKKLAKYSQYFYHKLCMDISSGIDKR